MNGLWTKQICLIISVINMPQKMNHTLIQVFYLQFLRFLSLKKMFYKILKLGTILLGICNINVLDA